MKTRSERLARRNVLSISPYVSGKPIDEVKREFHIEQVIKLASNENCLGPSPKALKAMMDALGECHIYPDGACYRLKQALASHWGMDAGHFLIGNGSDEILKLIGEAFLHEDEEVVFGWPSFSEYAFVANLMGATLRKIPLEHHTLNLDAIARAISPKTKLVFLCNPNNPTGTIVRKEEVGRFLDRVPEDVIVILDEAYAEYVEDTEYPVSRELIEEGHNVVALRTFSKIYGLAGLRVGYAMADPSLVEVINRVREPFNVNSLAQVGAVAALDDTEHLEASRRVVKEGKRQLYEAFRLLEIPYVPSFSNFILLDVSRDADEAFRFLLQKGIVVRPTTSFGLPTHIRVTVGREEENETFIQGLREFLRTP